MLLSLQMPSLSIHLPSEVSMQGYPFISLVHVLVMCSRFFCMQVLHQGRIKTKTSKTPQARQLLDGLNQSNQFYAAPFGSNDDW